MCKKTFIMSDNNNQYFGISVYFFLLESDFSKTQVADFAEKLSVATANKDAMSVFELFYGLAVTSVHFKEFGKYIQPVDEIERFTKSDIFITFILELLTNPEKCGQFVNSITTDIWKGIDIS